MGLRDIKDLPIVERIQPVLPIGDVSGLTPAYVPPTLLVGGAVTGVGGQVAACTIHSLASGGTIIGWLSFALSVAGNARYGILAADPLPGGPTPVQLQASIGTPLAVGDHGVRVALLNATYPYMAGPVTAPVLVPGPIYVPQGRFFYLETVTNGTGLYWSAIAQDVPPAEGQP